MPLSSGKGCIIQNAVMVCDNCVMQNTLHISFLLSPWKPTRTYLLGASIRMHCALLCVCSLSFSLFNSPYACNFVITTDTHASRFPRIGVPLKCILHQNKFYGYYKQWGKIKPSIYSEKQKKEFHAYYQAIKPDDFPWRFGGGAKQKNIYSLWAKQLCNSSFFTN